MIEDLRFSQESEREVLAGGELLLKGALETEGGVGLLTGTPVAPFASFFRACSSIRESLQQRGMLVRPADSGPEAIALLHGVQLAGCRAVATLGGRDFHACTQELNTASGCGVHDEGGALVVVGDDTWGDTPTPTDSRRLFEHLRIPFLEPADPQQVKDWVDVALRLSAFSGGYVGMRLTSERTEGGGTVTLRQNHDPRVKAGHPRMIDDEELVQRLPHFAALPVTAVDHEGRIQTRLERAVEEARRLGVNAIENRPHKGESVPVGFIAVGSAAASLDTALDEMGLSRRMPILRLGMVWPLDHRLVYELAAVCADLFIIEAGAPFVEPLVQAVLAPLRQAGPKGARVWGKTLPNDLPGLDSRHFIHPSTLIERFAPLLQRLHTLPAGASAERLQAQEARIREAKAGSIELPPRTPTFCAGCPQRDVAGVLRELRHDLHNPAYMNRVHRVPPMELTVHGDVGCTSLLSMPPHASLSPIRAGAGLTGAAAAAAETYISNRQVVFMGDRSFFRTGRTAVAQAARAWQDVLFVLVGDFPETHEQVERTPIFGAIPLPIARNESWPDRAERFVRRLQVPRGQRLRVVRADPNDREGFRDALERAVVAPGVKVVIADKPCVIAKDAPKTPPWRSAPTLTRVRIVEDVCEHCLECTRVTGCPALKVVETDYGPKTQTNDSLCVNDEACARIQVCPSFERITIIRGSDPPPEPDPLEAGPPPPPRPFHAEQSSWSCAIAGVGGMGIDTTLRLLAMAGREMGFHTRFSTRKGLAVRTGPVFGRVAFHRDPVASDPGHLPYGSADLLVSLDPLEGARAVDGAEPYRVASKQTTACVLNTAATPTIPSLLLGAAPDSDTFDRAVLGRCRPDRAFWADLHEIARDRLGDARFANTLALGVAFQLGYIPVTRAAMERAIQTLFGASVETNLRAFQFGRLVASDPARFGATHRASGRQSIGATLRRMRQRLTDHFGTRKAHSLLRRYLPIVRRASRALRASGADPKLAQDLAIRAADCIVWRGGFEHADRYVRRVLAVLERDSAENTHAATRAVLWNLAKVMLIKDEVYVAALLSNPGKRRADEQRFGVDTLRGDRILYHRAHSPQLTFLGRRHTYRWHSSDWQLRILAACRFLRAIPGWSRKDRRFREWYEKLIERFLADTSQEIAYPRWVAALNAPQQVTGYRDIRWPRLDAARAAAEAALTNPDATTTPEPRVRVSLSEKLPPTTM